MVKPTQTPDVHQTSTHMTDLDYTAQEAPPGSVRVAVVGTGSIGTRHLEVLRGISGVKPVAVPKRPLRASKLAQEGYAAVSHLDEAGADLCIIATDTSSHVTDGIAALDLGLDLLVEKPLAVNASEARRLTGHAARTQRQLFVANVLRFSESLNSFRRLLPEIGSVHAVRIEAQSFLPDWRPSRDYLQSYSARPVEGGVLLDLIHEIDYAGWLFGWPDSVQGRLRNLGRLGIAPEEVAELTWETSAGCSVSIRLDYLSKPPHRQVRAYGNRGTLAWDGITGTVTLIVEGAPPKELMSSQARNEMFCAQDHAFVAASRGYSDPRLATGDEGVKALAVCDAARRSSESRREERVEYL